MENNQTVSELKSSKNFLIIWSGISPLLLISLYSLNVFSILITTIISIAIWVLQMLLIGYFVRKWDNFKYFDSYKGSKSMIFGYKTRERLFGILKEEKKVNLPEIAEVLKITPDELKVLIYEIIGTEEIKGEFNEDKNTFILTSDIEPFLEILDVKFEEWAKLEAKEKKL